MNNIACFLLCFASDYKAFNIFSLLLEKVFPKDFFLKSNKGNGLIGFLSS